jgi:SAM-dependent methyltransferase
VRKYDLNLLEALNEEFKYKPFMKSFPLYDHNNQFMYAEQRLSKLANLIDINSKIVLEVGCGGGFVSRKLASDYSCEVVGIDIYKSEVIDELGQQDGFEFKTVDLAQNNPFTEGTFDLIVSYVAWEHMKHPFTVLKECLRSLKPDGHIYIYANQYRSPIASHLYRTIFFPFPHLLFPEEVIIEYCLKKGVSKEWIDAFFFVNKLTYCHYKEYFKLLSLEIVHEKLIKRKLDLEFYDRFQEKLGLYPIFDLELDFFEVVLKKIKNHELNNTISSTLTTYKIKPSKGSPQPVNEIINWSIQANGSNLEYAWYIYKNGERFETIWYSKENNFDWIPNEIGNYRVKAFVKDENNNIVSDTSEDFYIIS